MFNTFSTVVKIVLGLLFTWQLSVFTINLFFDNGLGKFLKLILNEPLQNILFAVFTARLIIFFKNIL